MLRTTNYVGIVHHNLTLFAKLSNYQIAIRIKIALEVTINNTIPSIPWTHITRLTFYEPQKAKSIKWIKISNVKKHLALLYLLTEIIACTELEFTWLKEEVLTNVFEFRRFRIQYQQKRP